MPLAIVSALPEEQQGLQLLLTHTTTERHAGRTFTRGMFHGQEVVLALSGIGKVAAATTTAVLMERFAIQRLVFTGVAGGLAPHVRVGDVVVATQFVQHDMDVRPLFTRWQVPGYAAPTLACDAVLSAGLLAAAQACVAQAAAWNEPLLAGNVPRAHAGLVASGDQFIVSAAVAWILGRTVLGRGPTAAPRCPRRRLPAKRRAGARAVPTHIGTTGRRVHTGIFACGATRLENFHLRTPRRAQPPLFG